MRINENLIQRTVMRFFSRELPPELLEEAVQQASLGLWTAALKYDTAKGAAFSTYANYWMFQTLVKMQKENFSKLYIPSHVMDKIQKVMKQQGVRDIYSINLDLIGDPKIRNLVETAIKSLNVDYIDENFSDEDSHSVSEHERIADENIDVEEQATRSAMREEFMAIMKATLTDMERQVMILLFGFSRSGISYKATEVQEILDLSKARFKKEYESACSKLKEPLMRYKNVLY